MDGNDQIKTRKCLECGKKVLVVRGKSGDDGHSLDAVTAYFECKKCGLRAAQYYRIELSPDRKCLRLPNGVDLPCEFVCGEVDAQKTWIGSFSKTQKWKIYVDDTEHPERKPSLSDLKKLGNN